MNLRQPFYSPEEIVCQDMEEIICYDLSGLWDNVLGTLISDENISWETGWEMELISALAAQTQLIL